MEHPPIVSPTKATGIPRFSKLPTPGPRTSLAAVPLLDKDALSKSVSRLGTARGSASPAKTTLPRAATTRSIASPVKSTMPTPARPASSLSDRTPSYLKKSTTRPPSRLTQPKQTLTATSRTALRGEDANDCLASLDSFRSASRQGYHDRTPSIEQSVCESLPETEEDVEQTPKLRKTSRPSLSDRTIESLSQLPSTPGTAKRRTSFFAPQSPMLQSPMLPHSRPATAMGTGRRPTIREPCARSSIARSVSPLKRLPLTTCANPASKTPAGDPAATPSRRVSSVSTPKFSQSVSSMRSSGYGIRPSLSASVSSTTTKRPNLAPPASARPVPSKVTKPRPTDAGLNVKKTTSTAQRPSSSIGRAQLGGAGDTLPKTSNASATLREQIAQAKAYAKRAGPTKHDSLTGSGESAFDLSADPFNKRPENNKGLLLKRIDAARADGQLSIQGMGLSSVPSEVMTMYDADQMIHSSISWSETVDLVRFNAADNELDVISDDVFPDIDRETAAMEEDAKGLQFCGLKMLDLHGNSLSTVPVGLRRLERLTTLDLSHNKITNSVLETISQITTLTTLKLGHNSISGYLPQCISRLENLETLDLQANKLLSLPECLRELIHLRILNVSGNQLTGLPMDALEALPMIELNASCNALVGALFPFSVGGLPYLQALDISCNSLASLAYSENLSLPAIRVLNMANNRITALPDMSPWLSLITLSAADNKIAAIPTGLTMLREIRHADLSGNNLTRLDEKVALMDNLDTLLITCNPLKERKFLTMTTNEIKISLRTRLDPASMSPNPSDSFEDEAIDMHSPQELIGSPWKLATSGSLHLGSKELCDSDTDALRSFLGTHDVRELQLSRNSFTTIPFELSLAQNLRVLDMSACQLGARCLEEPMALPALRELYLGSNRMTSLEPLMQNLHAPYLQHLDVSNNKLAGVLPVLRNAFPRLIDLYAADNKVESISAEALAGFHSVVLARNNIMHVPPEIGLLWQRGLKGLDLGQNAFRVPGHRILEKGTETVLAWLRDRIPGTVMDGLADDETF